MRGKNLSKTIRVIHNGELVNFKTFNSEKERQGYRISTGQGVKFYPLIPKRKIYPNSKRDFHLVYSFSERQIES